MEGCNLKNVSQIATVKISAKLGRVVSEFKNMCSLAGSHVEY